MRVKPYNVLHVLGKGEPGGNSALRFVRALCNGLSRERYRTHVWFLDGAGPLADEFRQAGVQVRVLNWAAGDCDPVGAWRFLRAFRPERFSILHQHCEGRFVRLLPRMTTRAKVVLHLHGRPSGTLLGTRLP